MYKFKLGMRLYFKKLILNLIILAQLIAVVFSFNMVIGYANGVNYGSNIFKNMENTKLFFANANFSADEKIVDLLPPNTRIYKRLNINADLLYHFFDFEFLTKLNYKPYKGRWFSANDERGSKAIISYTEQYKIGDTVTLTLENSEYHFEIIGMLSREEKILSSSKSGNHLNGNFEDTSALEKPVIIADISNVYNLEKYRDLTYGKFYFELSPDASVDYELVSNLRSRLEEGGVEGFFSLAELIDNDRSASKEYMMLMLPLGIIILIISLFGFMLVGYITFKNSIYELELIKELGARKKDLYAILLYYLMIPIVIAIITAIFIVPPFYMLLFGRNDMNYINYTLSAVVLLAYLSINFVTLKKCLFHNNAREGN